MHLNKKYCVMKQNQVLPTTFKKKDGQAIAFALHAWPWNIVWSDGRKFDPDKCPKNKFSNNTKNIASFSSAHNNIF